MAETLSQIEKEFQRVINHLEHNDPRDGADDGSNVLLHMQQYLAANPTYVVGDALSDMQQAIDLSNQAVHLSGAQRTDAINSALNWIEGHGTVAGLSDTDGAYEDFLHTQYNGNSVGLVGVHHTHTHIHDIG